LAKVREALEVPICVGERRYTRFGFRDLIAAQAVDMIMPDVVRTGGIAETKKIAAMAETFHISVAPHNPNSPISTLVSMHAAIGMHNFIMLEFIADDAPWRDDIMDPPLRVEQGYLVPPDRPGIGAELNMKQLKKHLADV